MCNTDHGHYLHYLGWLLPPHHHSRDTSKESSVWLSLKFHIITEYVDSVDVNVDPLTTEALKDKELDIRRYQ